MSESKICPKCKKIYKGYSCPNCGTAYPVDAEHKKKVQTKMDNRSTIEREYGFSYKDVAKIYREDAKKADMVYKSYITNGVSRIEKVNGRFLASQLVKLDILSQQNNQIIKQNNEIIELLKEIAKK